MALETLLVKQFQNKFEGTRNVIATSDLKLLCIHNNRGDLLIFLVNFSSSQLLLKNIKEFSWQEDNYCQNNYHLLVVNENNEILYYSVKVETCGIQHLVESKLATWTVDNIFRYFGELAKCLEKLSSVKILKFEAREAVCLFNQCIVAAFFPSCEENPQIMSISDLRYDSPSYRKVLISKEILFALNDEGTKLSIHSFANNTKLFDIEFIDGHMKQSEIGSVVNYTVNLKLDLLVYVTEKQQVYIMPLNVSKFFPNSAHPQGNSSITAFTKQFPSVKRLNEKMRRFSTSSTSSLPVSFNCELDDFVLKELIVVENKIFFLQNNSSESLVGVHLLNSDQSSLHKRFSDPVHFIKNGSEETPFPLLLLSEDKMFLLLYDVEQDKLVNELMIYPSSETVETLSSLNNWVNMHMDIEVLKLGLSNRQLYTVEFFLKTLYEGFCQLSNSSKSLQWLKKMDQECLLWTKILDLVLENVYKNLDDSHSCQYAEQLLQVIIGMVTQILAEVEDKVQIDEHVTLNVKEAFLKTFSELLLKMRKLLREFDSNSDDTSELEESSVMHHTYDDQIQLQWKQWEKLDLKEVIQDSILRGMIPMAQSYFSCCCKENCSFSYVEFENVAKELVLDYLRQGKLDETIVILVNMGANINQRLLDIFKATSEKDVRALLVTELMSRNLLTDQDLESLRFVSLLEKLYSCSSFEHARILLEKKSALIKDMICAVPENNERLLVGDFKNFIQDNSETGAYCRLVIEWLKVWDNEIKGRILAPLYLTNSSNLESILKTDGFWEADKMSIWFYLLENGNLPYLMNWIDIWLGIHPQSTDSFSLFDKWPLTKDMIDAIPVKATKHVSEALLNILARHGIFCEEEQENITLFLTRVGRAQCNINDLSIFSSDKATITFSELCHRLVHYFLKHNLIHFLYTFIDENYGKFTTWPSCPLCLVPVFHLTVAFYKWSQNHNDVHLAYEAVSETASYLFNLSQSSPSELLVKVPLPLAVSILLFKPQSLKESIDEIMQSSEETIASVRTNFQNYPLLYNYLFKTDEERSQPDVTVYELLKDNTVFDTSQLFGWQSANSLRSEDSQNELPHFSLQSLSEQFGLKKELTYLYYLMEGRPNYSYLKFFAQEVILETGLSLSRVRATCREVIDYALTNYKALDICASCIAFIELLGQDSLPLRASLIAANMLHDSRISEGDSDYDKSFPDIGRKFKQAYIDKTHALSLVSELENIILNKWNPFNCDADSLFQDVILWMPAMTISHLYEVEAGNHYLYECAKQNKWLQFLVFAQIFQIPKEQVLKAASRFSNSCISYHIFHSLHRKSSLLYDVAYETKSVSSLKSQKKDMRRSLYTRIGVIKDTPVESKKNTEPDDDKISVTSEETSTSSDTDLRSYVLKDLFSQLLLAHGTDFPSDCLLHTCYEIQNPILAALAASYPEAPIEACFFMWLYTSLSHNETIQKQLETFFPELRIPNINTDDLENLIVIAIHRHKILTLWQGVHIFLPSTPLPSLMGFLRSFIVYKRFDSSIEAFQNKLWDYPKNTEKSSVLHSLFWIENISVTILKEVVISCSSNYERQLLLRHFSHTRLEKSFSKEVVVPQFIKVYHMRQCLGDVAQDIDVKNLFLPEHDSQYKATCWEAITKLLQHHSYEDAQLFSEHAKLPQDQMLMLQINQETDEARVSPSWQDLHIRIHFWQNLILKLQVLSLHTAVDFLEVQCEISDMHGEKYFLIKSIIGMIKDNLIQGSTDGTIYNLDSLNKKMWWFCIKAEVNNELLPEIFDVKAVFELNIQEIFFSKKVQPNPCCIEDEKEKEALGSIIGRFLSKSDIHSAFQLALTFGYDSLDLKIIKLCFEVAKGEINIDSVDRSMPDCSNDIASTRVIQSLILWVNKKSTDLTPLQKSIIQCIKDLSLKCIIAVKICYRILVHYIVSLILKEDFINVAQEKNAFSILKKILVLKLNDELVTAKSFIVVRDLSDKEVAEFLSEEIWNSLKLLRSYDLVKIPEEESAFSEQVIYDPLRANEGFQLIVKLCQNPSVLGYSLMSIYSTESAELTYKSSDVDFTVLVDLCICAHECFTAACNMDGISQILHNAQTLVTLLEEAEKFSTMVHLLTGLDRYSEMMYVFDILKSHDKFSILFEKKMDNMPNLRLALLDYLKKYPPSENDNYFYTLANRFGMHREKAEILEMSVQKLLSQLCKKNSALDSDMKDELENALQILSDAAKSYCMADCLHQAQNCTRLAQLVALQIYFVPDGVWIIGLDETSVARFITDHNKFSQAFIVAEEYGNHHLWSQALLHNVVIRGDRDYLLEFQAHFGLPTSLISDVVKRYKKLPTKNENTTRNMKLLLSMCSNIKVKYSLAHEMGFADVLSELLMGEASSYLQDLIANNSIK